MDLLEHQGKALFRRHGIPVPAGALWPDLPSGNGPLVVKAQVPAGGRGRRGGIGFAETPESAATLAGELSAQGFDGLPVAGVYVEERLDIARELYLAVTLDRDRRCLMVLASPHGGMAVEDAPSEDLLRLPIDPLLGLCDFHSAEVSHALGLPPALQAQAVGLLRALYGLVLQEDATLAEINPLALTHAEVLVAADAKVVLDDAAAFRRHGMEEIAAQNSRSGTVLERGCAEAGAVGIEIDPDGEVMAVVSGAGLMMATLDILAGAGLKVRGVVDLGGTVLAGGAVLAQVFDAVSHARAPVTFFNAYLHTAHADKLAEMLVEAHRMAPLEGQVLARLKGRDSEAGRTLLHDAGFEVFEELAPAIAAVRRRLGGA